MRPHHSRAPMSAYRPTSARENEILRVRWLGRLPYAEAWDLQRGIHEGKALGRTSDDYLLLLEHPQLVAERRLRHVQALGRPAEVQLLSHRDEVAQLAYLHVPSLPPDPSRVLIAARDGCSLIDGRSGTGLAACGSGCGSTMTSRWRPWSTSQRPIRFIRDGVSSLPSTRPPRSDPRARATPASVSSRADGS